MGIENHEPDALLARAYALDGQSIDQTKALYRDWVSTYDATMVDGLAYLSPARVASMVVAIPTARILDLGCGTGLASAHLRSRGYLHIDGLDFSAEMLAEAKRLGRIDTAIEADLNKPLPAIYQRYDVIVSTGTFTHGHVGPGCLAGLFDLLEPSGELIASIHQDLWTAGGFEDAIVDIMWGGDLGSVTKHSGKLFATDTDDTGWFVRMKRKGLTAIF